MPSGGRRIGAGRPKGQPNKANAAVKRKAGAFFEQLLDDETEAKFWRYFMSGYVEDILEDGTSKIIPIPLNPVAFSAFKRAVEYKRGLPIQTVAIEEREPLEPGASFFETTNVNSGLCKPN